MTAGSGILHIETPPAELVESGGVFHHYEVFQGLVLDGRVTDSGGTLVVSGADAAAGVLRVHGNALVGTVGGQPVTIKGDELDIK